MGRALHRRTFAALTASVLAGCVSVPNDASNDDAANDSEPDGDEPSTDGSDETDPDGTGCSTESVDSPDPYPDLRIEPDDGPDGAEVSVCARPVQEFSDVTPATIAVELTNVGDEPTEYFFGVSPPYGGVFAAHQDRDAALYLVPDDREHVEPDEGLVPAEPTEGCWRAGAAMSVEDIGLAETIDPGETVREEYTLLAAPGGECLAPGTYRTEEDSYDPVGETWGFEITLSG